MTVSCWLLLALLLVSGGEEGCALFLLMVLLVGLYRFLFAL